MIKEKYDAEIITPATAEQDRMIPEAEARAVKMRSRAIAPGKNELLTNVMNQALTHTAHDTPISKHEKQ